jgi:hypothetical protein
MRFLQFISRNTNKNGDKRRTEAAGWGEPRGRTPPP